MSETTTTTDTLNKADSRSSTASTKGKPRALLSFAGLGGVILAVTAIICIYRAGHESTDDAQIESRLVGVAPRITGQVKRVLVQDNQLVEEGTPLVELDSADTNVRVIAARADVGAARAGLDLAKSQLALEERTIAARIRQAHGGVARATGVLQAVQSEADQVKAELDIAESRARFAELALQRAMNLVASNAVSKVEVDQKSAEAEQARAALDVVRARRSGLDASARSAVGSLDEARGHEQSADTGAEQLAIARASVALAQSRLLQAEAALTSAELAESYTLIKAPSRGLVSRRTVEVGQIASPERPLLALVPPDDVWVVANFKEDQINGIRPGCRAHMTLDANPHAKLLGHVDSIAGASGARFSLLPPDNASGNFIKVVQRIPVLIRFDAREGVVLRPGMSVSVTVETRKLSK